MLGDNLEQRCHICHCYGPASLASVVMNGRKLGEIYVCIGCQEELLKQENDEK
jgi:predicted SprT family Zn-dependent metalloprotease